MSLKQQDNEGIFSAATSDPMQARNKQESNSNDPTTDLFATFSLQAAASAVLAAQQRQSSSELDASISDLKSSLTETTLSPSTSNSKMSRDLSRSLSNSNGKSEENVESSKEKVSSHIERHMWSQSETKALVDGCNKHGIGNWKAILNDEDFAAQFSGRTPGDLKDRFRTHFPDAYHELYPNAKTHTSRAIRSKAADGTSIFEKGKTKERRPFSPAEDEVLKRGYEQHGSHWAIIAKEAIFDGKRKSTDLRDRFRNAFPNLYEKAGYKPRIKSAKKERRPSSGAGSFSHPERPIVLQTDWRNDLIHRPGLQSRSETSTSAHSQTVSEHSELSEEEEGDESRLTSRTIDANTDNMASLVAQQQSFQENIIYSMPFSDTLQSDRRRGSEAHLEGHHRHSSHLHGHSKPAQSLRRTQSTKRTTKIGTLDQAVRDAFSKSNREALLANHQQHHHLQHKNQQGQHQYQQDQNNALQHMILEGSSLKRPPTGQSFSASWLPRSSWPNNISTSSGSSIANVDLDQMGGLMKGNATAQEGNANSLSNDSSQNNAVSNIDLTTQQQQADFATMYNQLALATSAGNSVPNRPLAIESFQDLLDPMTPLNSTSMPGWDQIASNMPWTPVSSAAATTLDLANASMTNSNTNATRREHDHNQWAGDLLHPGNSIFTNSNQHALQGFVSMASMHLTPTSNTSLPLPSSRNSEDQYGNASPFGRLVHSRTNVSTLEQGLQRSIEQSTPVTEVTPSVNDLISRTGRRQSFPLRPLDNDEAMQAAYTNSYAYPADDISLLNSGAGASLTLFPSLVGHQGNADFAMRRRRSTDTLREGAYTFSSPWRGNFMDNSNAQILIGRENEDARQGDILSQHDPSEHSASMSDKHGIKEPGEMDINDDDDEDAPSRAASVGNLGITNARDNGLYAESLPDLSSGLGGEHASTNDSDSVFSSHHQLQISYDDMDLPSFLNRSPNMLHSTPAYTNNSNRIAQDLRNSSFKSWPFNLVSNETLRSQQNSMMVSGGSSLDNNSTRVPSKSVDLTNIMGFNSSFASNPIKDAGALDRLEHLYLEGLHTSASAFPFNQVNNGGASYQSYDVASNNVSTNQKQASLNSWWPGVSSSEKGANYGNPIGEASGYESV